MSKSMLNFTKGVVTGVVVGTTVSMVMHGLSKPAHNSIMHLNSKKGAGKMIKNIGSAISHINDMWK
ncbi:MAG: hypothetical protein FWF92_04020 [Oscillospiraceae bacterium]|nr:hypothetical protein [Oscillospiraceae bacterium]